MQQIRLFLTQKSLKSNLEIEIRDDDFHYLARVMRCQIGDKITIFNGFDGDFDAEIIEINKKSLKITLLQQIRAQQPQNNIILAFAPVKNVRIDFIAQKATEIGLKSFLPIITNHTIVNKINEKRFLANIKEACEQCNSNQIPEILPTQKLEKLLNSDFITNKTLILCDESGKGQKASKILPKINKNQEIIIFIGPEGGFSEQEFEKFAKTNSISMSLGSRILRSDTAIVSALTLINQLYYDQN